ncbi:MAG: sialidase family protein [Steroidobacteraceae bacterium]
MVAGCGRQPSHEAQPTALPSPAGPGSSLPHLASSPAGTLVLSWVEPAGSGESALKFSKFDGERWGAARTVAHGADWFLNWADFPSVVPIDETHWAAHWLVKREGGAYAYDVAIAISRDAGASWSVPVTPHLDGTATEHGFVSLFPAGGSLAAAWLDGRETSGSSHEDHGAQAETGAMTLRAARIEFDGSLHEQYLVDERVCDCCQTAATASDDGVLLAWRDRDEVELRDISVARFGDSGWRKLAGPAPDGWRIEGCPVNGPSIDSAGRHVALAWFTAADNVARVRLALSNDAGESFADPVEIAGPALGRVDVVALGEGGAIVSWLEATDDGAAIRLWRIDPKGRHGPVQSLALTTAARSSGFPQMERRGQDLVLAWTDAGEPSWVRTAILKGAAAD